MRTGDVHVQYVFARPAIELHSVHLKEQKHEIFCFWFFHKSTSYGLQIHTKLFSNSISTSRRSSKKYFNMSRMYVFSKKYLSKIDSNRLIFGDLIQRCLICISAISDSAKSASVLSETTLTRHQCSAKLASALSETALMLTSRCLCKYDSALSPTALTQS